MVRRTVVREKGKRQKERLVVLPFFFADVIRPQTTGVFVSSKPILMGFYGLMILSPWP